MAPSEDYKNPSLLAIDTDYFLLLQLRFGYRERKTFADDFAKRVNQLAAMFGIPPPDRALGGAWADTLRSNGFARIGPMLDRAQIDDLLAYFSAQPCFNAHVVAQSDGVGSTPDELAPRSHFGSYRGEDVVRAPHLLELANDPRVLSAVGDYLGCVPSLYSMNAWWSFPRPEMGTGITQNFHRDGDDFRNCVLFLYLTDTDQDGCHQYIRYSHDPDALAAHLPGKPPFTVRLEDGSDLKVGETLDELFAGTGYGRDGVYGTLFPDLVESIPGAAGEGFLSDPDGLHRATHPMTKRRLIVWLRYGMHRNCAYARDLIWPVVRAEVAGRLPETEESRFVNRLVVQPG